MSTPKNALKEFLIKATKTTDPPPYSDNGLWEPFAIVRTVQLVIVLVFGVLLVWPAADWRLPLVERFSYEVGNDTITLFKLGIYLSLFSTAAGFLEVQILKKHKERTWTPFSFIFGILGFVIHVYLVYYKTLYQSCTTSPLTCLWDLYNYDTISGLWASEIFRVSVVMGVFIFAECARNDIKYPWLYIIGMVILGTEFAVPIFLMQVRRREFTIAEEIKNKAVPHNREKIIGRVDALYAALFIINIVTWLIYIYRWADEFGSGTFVSLSKAWNSTDLNLRVLAGILLINFALFVWALPDIIADPDSTVSPLVVTWLLRFFLAGWFIGNTGATLALFLFLRENTKGLHFKNYNPKEKKDTSKASDTLIGRIKKGVLTVMGNGNTILGEFLSTYTLAFVGLLAGQLFPYHHVWFGYTITTILILYCHYQEIKISYNFQKWFLQSNVTKCIGTSLILVSFVLLFKVLFHDFLDDGQFSVPGTLYYILSQLDDYTLTAFLTFLVIAIIQYISEKFLPKKFHITRWMYLGLVFVVIGFSIGSRTVGCNLQLGQEYPVDADRVALETMVSHLVNNSVLPATRLQHEKSHGCIAAQFVVNEDIPNYLRHGIFAKSQSYNSIIRYSNGAQKVQRDREADTRGMAIKVFGVDGNRLMPQHENFTQDFVLISNPFFFASNPSTYVSLLETLENSAKLISWPWKTFPPQFTTLIKAILIGAQGKTVDNPILSTYYSTTPYRVGTNQKAYKWTVQPCANMTDSITVHTERDNYLREALEETVANMDVCLEFLVQPQLDACGDPLEDPTVMWHGDTIPVATIHIKRNTKSNNYYQQEYCKNMAFNPWNGIKEHVPLGNINRQRKIAYLAGYKTRMSINNESVVQPTFEHFIAKGKIDNQTYIEGELAFFQYMEYEHPNQNLPKYIANLPFGQTFDVSKLTQITVYTIRKTVESKVDEIKQLFVGKDVIDSFDYYAKLTDVSIKNRWIQDKEFARQFITGVNPTMITAVSKKGLPAAFNNSNGAITKMNQVLKSRNEPLFDALKKSGKLFYADYEILQDIHQQEGRVYHLPIAIFYVASNNTLLPLGIQLNRAPLNTEVFTPLDREAVWLFARIHTMHSDALVHEFVQHLCFTHLALEPIIIAFYRSLPDAHPILQLMKPHFRQTLAINDFGRKTLLKPGGIFDSISTIGLKGGLQLMNKAYNTVFNVTQRSVPRQLEERGFYEVTKDKTDNMPGYYFRDDAMKVWNAITRYVKSAVDNHYLVGQCGDDKDKWVREDQALQSLHRDLHRNALVRGMMDLNTDENLIEFLATVIWTASGQHSAVNFGQEDYYAFVPNRPFLMTKLMPEDHSKVDWKYIFSALPAAEQTKQSIATAHILSMNLDTQLGADAPQTFVQAKKGHPFPAEYTDFLVEMRELSKFIVKRNQELEDSGGVSYPYLNPTQIAASIAI